MKSTKMLAILVLALGLMVWPAMVRAQVPLDTAFTYQGCLNEFERRAQGNYDFQFALYDDFNDLDPSVGQEVCAPVEVSNVNVVDGHFALRLDFGGDVFNGFERWLEIRVRGAGGSNFDILSPRQEITLTPYAIYALDANTVDGFDAGNGPDQVAVSNGTVCDNLNADMVDGHHLWDLDGLYVDEDQPDSITSAMIQDGAIQFVDMNQDGAASGQVMKWNGFAWVAADDVVGSGVPQGGIIMWSGDSIPEGWALCDGNNGTPDLRNMFIVGAGDEYAVSDTGGERTHRLTINEMPKHHHSYQHHPTWRFSGDSEWGGKGNLGTYDTGDAGDDRPHENRPPFYALAYIMRLP